MFTRLLSFKREIERIFGKRYNGKDEGRALVLAEMKGKSTNTQDSWKSPTAPPGEACGGQQKHPPTSFMSLPLVAENISPSTPFLGPETSLFLLHHFKT